MESVVFKIEISNWDKDQGIPKVSLRSQKVFTGFVERMAKSQTNFDPGDGVTRAISSGQRLLQN